MTLVQMNISSEYPPNKYFSSLLDTFFSQNGAIIILLKNKTKLTFWSYCSRRKIISLPIFISHRAIKFKSHLSRGRDYTDRRLESARLLSLSAFSAFAELHEGEARGGMLQRLHEDHERRSLHSNLLRGLPSWHLRSTRRLQVRVGIRWPALRLP